MQAIKLLHDAIEELPMDYSLLDCQSSFCQSKGRLDWSLECAKRSVTAAPSEFGTWAKLAEVYVGLEQWDLALLTLNSCPMFTYQDRDAPRMPEPARVLLPVLPESMLDEIDESSQAYDIESVHPSLRRLHAASYKGTFLKAYNLLTQITAKIGWDQLLKVRSQVFVMEEEYRSEKQTGGSQAPKNASTVALPPRSPMINGADDEEHAPNGESSERDEDETLADFSKPPVEDASTTESKATLAEEDSLEKPNHTVPAKSEKEDVGDSSPLFTNIVHLRP